MKGERRMPLPQPVVSSRSEKVGDRHVDMDYREKKPCKVGTPGYAKLESGLKEGHLIQIVIEDYEEITVMRKKEQKKKREKAKNGRRERAAKKIQAWWRGTLVRRTLLHAALSTWIIQSWWKLTMDRLLQKKRRAALIAYAHRERAVVKLQSLVRMWRIHWRYCQVLNAIYVIQHHWQYHNCQTCALLRGHCVVTATHLQFHIEIINP
ncbi:hypothetical protein MG293_017645 [Ovis ammon polii]|uniref:IQ domain-containing protein F2 n=2 Tax=Ovis TaxID=9935 RepID=A0A835ZXT0_SHEEP|nr:hypothetical protein JEQ12_008421 [Ovis aries]KAI4532380.1 hypothetical protein MG293_017645 [Ovis ammon polii]